MLTGLIAPRLHLDYALASISCEHCRPSRDNPHYAPRHIIYYYSKSAFYEPPVPFEKWALCCPYRMVTTGITLRFFGFLIYVKWRNFCCFIHDFKCRTICNYCTLLRQHVTTRRTIILFYMKIYDSRVELLILYWFSKMLHFRGLERIKRGVLAA